MASGFGTSTGFSLVRGKSGRKLIIPGQGKVREFWNWSGNLGLYVQIREKSGNLSASFAKKKKISPFLSQGEEISGAKMEATNEELMCVKRKYGNSWERLSKCNSTLSFYDLWSGNFQAWSVKSHGKSVNFFWEIVRTLPGLEQFSACVLGEQWWQ